MEEEERRLEHSLSSEVLDCLQFLVIHNTNLDLHDTVCCFVLCFSQEVSGVTSHVENKEESARA